MLNIKVGLYKNYVGNSIYKDNVTSMGIQPENTFTPLYSTLEEFCPSLFHHLHLNIVQLYSNSVFYPCTIFLFKYSFSVIIWMGKKVKGWR